MKQAILAIEASSRQTSVAAWGAIGLIFFEKYLTERRQTGPLASIVAACCHALDECGVEGVGLAVGTGPGSYNGLRAACALAQGLSLARGWPLGGWSSFLGLGPGHHIIATDARNGQWAVACTQDGSFVESPRLVSLEEGALLTAAWAAEGRGVLTWLGEKTPADGWQQKYPSAGYLAQVAWAWLTARPTGVGAQESWPQALPLYLKPPSITPAKTTVRTTVA